MSLFDDVPSLSPVQFFGVTADCFYSQSLENPNKDFQLPQTSDLLGEETFAEVFAAWNVDKLMLHFQVDEPFQKISEPDFRLGDSVEVWIDTRDMKTKGVVSKFCHHFVFFPALSQNFYGREVTRFRGEDTHSLCHPEDLQITSEIQKNGYSLSIEIPAHCLHGFDPLNFTRLGFTYRINRTKNTPQHFAVSSEEYVIEQHPATWGTLKLLKE